MNWKLQILKKTITERLPFKDKLRLVKRKLFGYPPNPSNIDLTLRNYSRIKEVARQNGLNFKNSVVLEIGSGWFPTIPIMLSLEGAKKIFMSDLNPHMDEITFTETTKYLKLQFPKDKKIQGLNSFNDLPINYLAPLKVEEIDDSSLDIVISRTVLEHIPKKGLTNLFSALQPKMAKHGIMIHLIDHSDHFEHKDKSISRINFLTWSVRKHAFINYLIKDGENRMRHHEYKPLFENSGYEVIDEIAEINKESLEISKTLNLSYPFANMTSEQLAILTSIYVLRPS